jgi:type IV pilus assembly protein PilV
MNAEPSSSLSLSRNSGGQDVPGSPYPGVAQDRSIFSVYCLANEVTMASIYKSKQCAHDFQHGFSLIEVLVAITILAVGLLGIAGLQVHSIRYNSGANIRSVEAYVAQGVMEEITSLSQFDPIFSTTSLNNDWDFDPRPSVTETELELPGAGTFTALWSVTTNDPLQRIARVAVTVTNPNGVRVSMTNFKRFL